jgi:hypothetical protein
MSSRENIAQEIYAALKSIRTVKLGVVSRDPIIPEELPKTGFPAVSVESMREERVRIANTMGESIMEVELVLYVAGKNRDQQLNTVIEGIDNKLAEDRTLNKNAKDLLLTRIEAIQTGEAAPYGSMRLVYTVRYCYTM